MNDNNILKVVIADDEHMVCVVINKNIHWAELGMELVGIAYDGNELFELILQNKPDIVITDISMPDRNGLELIELVRKENIKCRIVIISGYKQFEYAHTALKNNVDDYLLKPIDEQELNETLLRIRKSILEEKMVGKEKVNSLIVNNKKDKEKIRQMFLTQLMEKENGGEQDTEKIGEKYGIIFEDGIYQAVIIKLDFLDNGDIMDDLSSVIKKLEQILKKIFTSICQEFLVVAEETRVVSVLYYEDKRRKEIRDGHKTVYEKGKNIVELFHGYAVTGGVSKEHSNISGLSMALKEANDAICFRLRKGTDRIIYYEELTIPEQKWVGDSWENLKGALKADFEILNINSFHQHLNKIFFVDQETCNMSEMVDISKKIIRLFFSEMETAGSEHPKAYEKLAIGRIENSVSLYKLKAAVLDSIIEVMAQLEEKRKNQKKKPMREAQKYISKYYMENLTLERVASEVNLNPVYFSNSFKKEMGENFLDYLHKYRIEVAKEILRNENCTIVETAMRVGYSDAKYFSKIFKKYIGIKPSDYRKIYG